MFSAENFRFRNGWIGMSSVTGQEFSLLAGRENINTTRITAFRTRMIRSVNSARDGSSQLRTLRVHARVLSGDWEFSAENFGSAMMKRAMSANRASPQIYGEELTQIHSLKSMACPGWSAIQLHVRFADLTARVVTARGRRGSQRKRAPIKFPRHSRTHVWRWRPCRPACLH